MATKFTREDLQKIIRDSIGEAHADRAKETEARFVERKRTNHFNVGDPSRHNPQATAFKNGDAVTADVASLSTDQKGLLAARCIRYYIAAGNDVQRAMDLAHHAGDKTIVDCWDKALGETTLAGGGALLPTEFSDAIIEELGAKAVVRKMGALTMPMNSGSLAIPYLGTSASAAYTGEGATATASQPTFGQLQLSDKELVCLVPVGNRLLSNGGPKVDKVIRDHMVRVMQRKEDATFIRSVGAAYEPQGMLYQAAAANKFDANATVNLANVVADLGTAVDNLMSGDVSLEKAGWLFAPRTYKYLYTVLDSNGNFVFKDGLEAGMLLGYPFAVTSQIPVNIGTGSDSSEVYFAAFDSLVIAENDSLRIQAFDGGAYHNGSATVSGVSQNETVVRATALHDFGAMQRGAEIAVIEEFDAGK